MTCRFTADNVISQVWVDGVDVTSQVSGDLTNWQIAKTLVLGDSASKLAIKAHDLNSGCDTETKSFTGKNTFH